MKIKYLAFVFCIFTFSSCHVGRFFIWNFADTNDNKKFPKRELDKSAEPYFFHQSDGSHFMMPKRVAYKGKEMSFEELMRKTKTVGFMVIRNDSIQFEKYYGNFSEEREWTSFSVAKSFVSALLGIAIDEGYIKSVDEPITKYLPELKGEGFDKITIQHLLNMRSGIKFNEGYFNPFGKVAKYYYGLNLKKYIGKLKVEKEPDQEFEYKSVNTQLLGFIVENATGKKLDDYLQEKIWTPLGMEFDASWSVDSKKNQNMKMFCCLNARMRDFAKLGRLYLNKGNWNGKQIVSQQWVEQSLRPEVKNNFMYSYQWWHNMRVIKNDNAKPTPEFSKVTDWYENGKKEPGEGLMVPAGDFFAEGVLGQFVYVYPEKNIIIVRLGKQYGGYNWPSLMLWVAKKN